MPKARLRNPRFFTEEQTQECARKTVSKARAAAAYTGRRLTIVAPGGKSRTYVVEKTRRRKDEDALEFMSGGHVVLTIDLPVAEMLRDNGVYAYPGGAKYILAGRKDLKSEQQDLLEKAVGFLNRNMEETNFHLKNAEKRETISQALVARDARQLKSLLRYHVRALERLMDRIQKEIIDLE